MTNKFKIMALLSVVSYGSLLPVHVFVENRIDKQLTVKYTIYKSGTIKRESLIVSPRQEVYLGELIDIIQIQAEGKIIFGTQKLREKSINSDSLKECWNELKEKPQGADAILFGITLWNFNRPQGDLAFRCGKAGYEKSGQFVVEK